VERKGEGRWESGDTSEVRRGLAAERAENSEKPQRKRVRMCSMANDR